MMTMMNAPSLTKLSVQIHQREVAFRIPVCNMQKWYRRYTRA